MKQIHGLNSFHTCSFVIVKNDEGKAVLHFKAWCTSEWDGEQYDPIMVLHDLPQGVPEVIRPNYDAVDFARLRGMVDKCVNNGVFTNGLFQKKSTPPRRMARWKFSWEGGSSALEIQVGGGV